MAIAKMLSMRLVALAEDKEKILSALHKTGAVEIVKTPEFFEGRRVTGDVAALKEKRDVLERASELVRRLSVEYKLLKPEADGFSLSYDEFMKLPERESEILAAANGVLDMQNEAATLVADAAADRAVAAEYAPYFGVNERLSSFKGSEKTACRLGTVDERNFTALAAFASEQALFTLTDFGGANGRRAVCAIYHTEIAALAEKTLSENGFTDCPFKDDSTASERIEFFEKRGKSAMARSEELRKTIGGSGESVKQFKSLSDYYYFLLQKQECEDGFLCTDSSFVLEAFVPEEREDEVRKAIEGVTEYAYCEFTLVPEGEYAPTLMKNKKVTKQFEFVTNLYSVPKYSSFDPNAILGVFFSAFMGFITGDAVYGLLMIVGGYLFARSRKRDDSMRRLAMVMVYSGIFTVLFGVAFDSYLGIPLLRNLGVISKPFLPDPISDTSSISGINVPSLLLIALGMGVVHIMAGLFITALIHFEHGRILDGIFDGIVWDIFLGGGIFAVLGITGTLPGVTTPAAIVTVVALAIGALTSGRHEKGLFGKAKKCFGSLYGLINYLSDILSYARLYGLMLSGAQIASIVSNQLALPMLTSPGGVGGVAACVLIMLVGHLFNIAMGLLGAFVHDARLQYVEFFSRFYEGDGELFTPFGMKFEHLYLE